MEPVDVESVPSLIYAWRQAHPRGPLPVALRRGVARYALAFGDAAAIEVIGLKREVIERWREEYAPTARSSRQRRSAKRSTFVEIRPTMPKEPQMLVEVAGPGGRVVRIQGALDLATLEAVIRCAVRAEA